MTRKLFTFQLEPPPAAQVDVTGECLPFRIVPRAGWVINNRDYSRRARNYNEENQTRPFTFDFTLS